MGYQRHAYDDSDSTGQMVRDCAACGERVDLPRRGRQLPLRAAVPPPGLPWAKFKDDIELTAAAAHLAAKLHLA